MAARRTVVQTTRLTDEASAGKVDETRGDRGARGCRRTGRGGGKDRCVKSDGGLWVSRSWQTRSVSGVPSSTTERKG
jgi:hypothetical protein